MYLTKTQLKTKKFLRAVFTEENRFGRKVFNKKKFLEFYKKLNLNIIVV